MSDIVPLGTELILAPNPKPWRVYGVGHQDEREYYLAQDICTARYPASVIEPLYKEQYPKVNK